MRVRGFTTSNGLGLASGTDVVPSVIGVGNGAAVLATVSASVGSELVGNGAGTESSSSERERGGLNCPGSSVGTVVMAIGDGSASVGSASVGSGADWTFDSTE